MINVSHLELTGQCKKIGWVYENVDTINKIKRAKLNLGEPAVKISNTALPIKQASHEPTTHLRFVCIVMQDKTESFLSIVLIYNTLL